MVVRRWRDLKARTFSKEQIERIDSRVKNTLLEMSLREVRNMAGKTQTDVAGLLEKTQGQISTIERRDDHLLSTVREYVQALGGEIEVVATFGDKTVKLRGI